MRIRAHRKPVLAITFHADHQPPQRHKDVAADGRRSILTIITVGGFRLWRWRVQWVRRQNISGQVNV